MSDQTNEMTRAGIVDDVCQVLVTTLGIADRADTMRASSGLFGSIPEFDSLAVVEVIAAIESRFGIVFEDEDVSVDVFATVDALTTLVERKLASE